jgi:predicted transcriptional regulator
MKKHFISIRVTDEFKKEVEEFSRKKRWSLTTVVVEALKRLMEKGDGVGD